MFDENISVVRNENGVFVKKRDGYGGQILRLADKTYADVEAQIKDLKEKDQLLIFTKQELIQFKFYDL